MTTLLIARHGNTFGPDDVVTRVGARTDLPLVESGLEQGRKLGRYLKDNDLVPQMIFTSHLLRTKQTAEKICEALGQVVPTEALDIFNEIDYGPDENQPEDIVKARLGGALRAWDEDGILPPDWIGDTNAIQQAWETFGRMVTQDYSGKTVLVVTSNGIARFAPVLTGDLEGFRQQHKLKLSTGALCRFDHGGIQWQCSLWNEKP